MSRAGRLSQAPLQPRLSRRLVAPASARERLTARARVTIIVAIGILTKTLLPIVGRLVNQTLLSDGQRSLQIGSRILDSSLEATWIGQRVTD